MACRADRAKQFMPFDALKGLQDALREKEIEYEQRKELTEESLTELQIEFNKIEIESKVKIRYYKNKKYIDVLGIITKIDYVKNKIQLDGLENINICDIIKLEWSN